jgi:asparagine synthase (glutamine-hydrolysing)
MHETYPLLDPDTVGVWNGSHGFAAWMHTSEDVAAARRYVHQSAEELVLYDGLVVNPSGTFVGHDARALAAHRTTLSDVLEGSFLVARLTDAPATLEILNDPLGVHPTFVHDGGGTWWVSNSVRLLARAAALTSVDVEGMAKLVGLYWPGGDRTLVRGASVLPAAQRWRWTDGAAPERSTYWPWTELAVPRKRSFGTREARELADAMAAPLATLSDAFAPLQCPITGGRDSRVLTGLMMSGNLPGDFFSAGEPDDPDVVFGTAIAERFGLPHRRSGRSTRELAAEWDDVVQRVVGKLDGMVTLMHARNALGPTRPIERLPVHLYGAAGEFGRGTWFTEGFVLRRPNAAQAIEFVRRKFSRGSTFLRPEARELVRAHIDDSCRALLDQGFEPIDLPYAFSLTEYSRRWGGAQARQGSEHRDVFMPFVTRAYMSAAFATPATERLLERVPYLLLEHLSSELRAMPGQKPWPPRSLAALLAASAASAPRRLAERAARRLSRTSSIRVGRSRDRHVLLEDLRPRWRERYLDGGEADLWQVVDRERFEFVTSDRVPAEERSRHLVNLYQVVTALAYEEDFRAWAAGGRSPI